MHKEETIIIAVYPSAPVEPYFDYCSLLWGNRELKQRRRRQQRRSSKRNRVVEQIDNSASASRFFWTFLCRPCPTATSNFIFFTLRVTFLLLSPSSILKLPICSKTRADQSQKLQNWQSSTHLKSGLFCKIMKRAMLANAAR